MKLYFQYAEDWHCSPIYCPYIMGTVVAISWIVLLRINWSRSIHGFLTRLEIGLRSIFTKLTFKIVFASNNLGFEGSLIQISIVLLWGKLSHAQSYVFKITSRFSVVFPYFVVQEIFSEILLPKTLLFSHHEKTKKRRYFEKKLFSQNSRPSH